MQDRLSSLHGIISVATAARASRNGSCCGQVNKFFEATQVAATLKSPSGQTARNHAGKDGADIAAAKSVTTDCGMAEEFIKGQRLGPGSRGDITQFSGGRGQVRILSEPVG